MYDKKTQVQVSSISAKEKYNCKSAVGFTSIEFAQKKSSFQTSLKKEEEQDGYLLIILMMMINYAYYFQK